MSAVTLEVCIDDAAGIAACVAGGADRIELCSALELGGLTPSVGLMRAAAACPIPAYAMIRPRAGDFRTTPAEVAVMRADVAAARSAGLAGVVLGAATADGRLDTEVLAVLIAEAGGLGLTLHRVIDTLPDRLAAVDQAVALGFRHVLTSGGVLRAPDATAALAAMRVHAGGRITVMAGSGIDADNAAALIAATGITAIHASCGATEPASAEVAAFGFGPARRRFTDPGRIRALKAVLRSV